MRCMVENCVRSVHPKHAKMLTQVDGDTSNLGLGVVDWVHISDAVLQLPAHLLAK